MVTQKIFEKKCNLVRFDVSLHTILGSPRQVPLHATVPLSIIVH